MHGSRFLPMHDKHPSFAARSQQNPSVNCGEAIQALLNHEQLRNVQVTAANILIEAFASGTLSCVPSLLLFLLSLTSPL